MKKITSFTHLTTGEGDRIAFTFSEISDLGEIISQNNKGGFIVSDENTKAAIEIIENKINSFLGAKNN